MGLILKGAPIFQGFSQHFPIGHHRAWGYHCRAIGWFGGKVGIWGVQGWGAGLGIDVGRNCWIYSYP